MPLVQSPSIRLPRHQATSAHACALYPFVAERGLGTQGVWLGTNVLTGGDGFWFDPFTAYQAGLVTNPNMLIAGEPGMGKSTATKTFLHRCVGALGRWVAIADPKGEYRTLGEELGLQIIDLYPGGKTRLNPLDIPATSTSAEEAARLRSSMVAALLATVLGRNLTSLEDAVLGWTMDVIAERSSAPTLVDVSNLLRQPTDEMANRATRPAHELSRDIEAARYGLDKLLDRSLRGMFDGPSTIDVDWSGRGIVLDLSRVHHEPDALAAVMVATTAWLQGIMAKPSATPRIQVLDEAWSLLSFERTSRYLQTSLKLGRAYGVANVIVVHRLSDLRSQADDGTAAAKIATGLLADTQTRVLFRQSSDQLPEARNLLGLTSKEAEVLGRLSRGRAIWKVGEHTAVVAHKVAPGEMSFCDTDARMITA